MFQPAARTCSRALFLWSTLLVLPLAAAGYSFNDAVFAIPSQVYGVAREVCETPSGGDVTLTTASAWQNAIETATPGARFFLRAGTYTTSELTIPNGTVSQRIQLKPYNCEAVTISALINPGHYTTIAGMTLSHLTGSPGMEGTINLVSAPRTGVIVRNNAITASGHFAIGIRAAVTDLLVTGNDIYTSASIDRAMLVYMDTSGTNVVFSANKFSNAANEGTDLVNPYEWSGDWTFTRNWFAANAGEDQVDLKFSAVGQTATFTLLENYFDGTSLPFGACLLVHNASDIGVEDGYEYTANVQGNYFYHCGNNALEHAVHDVDTDHRYLNATYNVFNFTSTASSVVLQSDHGHFEHNTMLSGNLKTGGSGINPADCVVRNNIFYQSSFQYYANIDTCTNNDFYQTTGQGSCTNSITSDPLFVNPASDWHLQAGSPAIGAGEGGVDLGAYAVPPPSAPPIIRIISQSE